MITNISLMTLWVTDQDEAKKFYVDTLGFIEQADVSMGGDFRWITISHPAQPELEITLMKPGPPMTDELQGAIQRALAAGTMNGFGIATNDCHKTYEELTAKGVEFVQPPSDRPYGVEAILRDNSGNWLVLVERREFSPEDVKDWTGPDE